MMDRNNKPVRLWHEYHSDPPENETSFHTGLLFNLAGQFCEFLLPVKLPVLGYLESEQTKRLRNWVQ